MYKAGWKGGRWSAICDRCGFRFHSDELIKEWDGLRVCKPCWEPRHPQDLIKIKPEKVVPPWTRPEPDDDFLYVCSLWGASAYADLAEADCVRADNTFFSYAYLLEWLGELIPSQFSSLYLGPDPLYLDSFELGL